MKQNNYSVSLLFQGFYEMYDNLGKRKYLSRKENRAFLKSVLQSNEPFKKRVFCLTLYFTGCRVTEALKLTVSSIDCDRSCLVFKTLKQREKVRYRAILVPNFLIKMLKQLTAEKAPTDLIFGFSRQTGWRAVKTHMEEIGVDGVNACPRGLRHTYAVSHVIRKTSISSVKKWLGHKELSNTTIYTDIMDEEERREARKVWPNLIWTKIILFFRWRKD